MPLRKAVNEYSIGLDVKVVDESGVEICRGKINNFSREKDWYQIELENSLPKFVNYPAYRVFPV